MCTIVATDPTLEKHAKSCTGANTYAPFYSIIGFDWPPPAACNPIDIIRLSFFGMEVLMRPFDFLSIKIVFFQNSCLCPTTVDVGIGRVSKNWVSKLGHPKPVSTQLVPLVVGDI